jgi:cytochrome c556
MMNVKWVALFLLLVGVLGWSAQDKKKGPKSKEVQKTYASLMEEVGKENKAIKKDIEEKKGDAAIKARLEKIKKNVEAASKLDYLKGEEEDLDRFKACFEVFLDIRMKQLTEATWDEKTSENLYERLQSSCRTCHELFRDE